MRICLVSLRALPAISEAHKHERLGGEEVQQSLLAQAFIRQGLDVRLIVGDMGQPTEAVYSGVPTINSHGVNLGFWWALRRADAEVYYYSCAGRLLGVLALFCWLYGRRLVFRVASDADCDPKRVEIKRPWDRWLYHWGLHRADSILVQTERQREWLSANHGLPSAVAAMLVERPAS